MKFGLGAVLVLLVAGCFGPPDLPLLSNVELAEGAPESGLLSVDATAPKTVLQALEGVENLPTVEAVFEDAAAPETSVVGGEIASVRAVVSEPKPARKGWFGPRRTKPSPSAQVTAGVLLPFSQIGLACGLRTRELGVEVDRFPARGKGYRLYDSDPSTTRPRTHYVTGFKDGCPRQFTASLALLESPLLHEKLLAVESRQTQHSTQADKAFQKIRARVCHTGRGKPCPEKRADEMEKSMAFITTYERFGGNASWTEILMHNGVIAANSLQE